MKTLIVFSLLAFASSAFANPSIKVRFQRQYPNFKNVTCVMCHTSPPQLNPYGIDLQKAELDFEEIEPLDSDGDTYSNIVEIKAKSMPGDKNSIPPPPAPTEN